MTGVLTLIVLCSLGVQVEIHVAPDQPLPHVYTDEPLILELVSDSAVTATGRMELVDAPGEAAELGPVVLHPGSPYWHSLADFGLAKGEHTLRVKIDTGGQIIERDVVFYRVERPKAGVVLPVCAGLDHYDAKTALVLKSLGIGRVRLNSALPDLSQILQAVVSDGFEPIITVLAGTSEDSESWIQSISEAFHKSVLRWELEPSGRIDRLVSWVEAIRRGGSSAPVGLVVRAAGEVAPMLRAGAGKYVSAMIFLGSSVEGVASLELSYEAERCGYEGLPLVSVLDCSESQRSGLDFARGWVSNCRPRVGIWGVCGDLLADAEGLGAGYAYASGIAHRFAGATCVGDLVNEAPLSVKVFRTRDGWLLAVWTTGSPQRIDVSVEGAEGLVLTDALNNVLPVPEIKEGAVRLTVGPAPLLLSGRGSSLVSAAAEWMAGLETACLLGDAAWTKGLPPEVAVAVQAFDAAHLDAYTHSEFFALLRLFPLLEEQWHAGNLRASEAVPSLSSLSRLVRYLAIMEEERGRSFITPLRDTLSRCRDYQSLYITSSGSASGQRERGDWVLGEVNRLMSQAESLEGEGRPVEAGAVAALAEWRARSLAATARAKPLSVPEKAPPQKADETPKVEEGATE